MMRCNSLVSFQRALVGKRGVNSTSFLMSTSGGKVVKSIRVSSFLFIFLVHPCAVLVGFVIMEFLSLDLASPNGSNPSVLLDDMTCFGQ